MKLLPKQQTFWILVILAVNRLVISFGQDHASKHSMEVQNDDDDLQTRSDPEEQSETDNPQVEAAEEQKELPDAKEEKQEIPAGEKSGETEDELQARSFGFFRPMMSPSIQDMLRQRMNWMMSRYQLSPGGLPLPSIGMQYPQPGPQMGGPDMSNVGLALPAVGGNKWVPWSPPVHPWAQKMAQQQQMVQHYPHVPPPMFPPPQQHVFPGAPAGFAPSFDLQADIRLQPDVPQLLQPELPLAPERPEMYLPLPPPPPPPMLPPEQLLPPELLPPPELRPPMLLPPPEQPLPPELLPPMLLPPPEQPLPPELLPPMLLPPPEQPLPPELLPPMLLPPPEQPLPPELLPPMLPPPPEQPPPPPQQHPPMVPPPQAPNMVEHPMATPMEMRDVQRDLVEEPQTPVRTVRIKDIRNRKRSYPNCGQKPQHAKQLEQMEAIQMGKFKERISERRKKRDDERPLWRVVSGEVSVPDSWPWMSGIFSMKEGKKEFFCGSALISEWFVLTAAHCFDDVEGILNPEVYKVTLGHNIRWEGDTYDVQQVLIHPGYRKPQFYHDLTLMKTKRQVVLSQSVHPICLPSYTLAKIELMPQVDKLTFAGWGINHEEGEDPSVTLKELTVPVFPHDQCNKSYQVMLESFPNGITDHFICAGLQEGGKDTCKGDSGGPLVAELSDKTWMQLGVLSSGYGCARAGFPGLYTKVADYLDWIYYNSDLMGGVFMINRNK